MALALLDRIKQKAIDAANSVQQYFDPNQASGGFWNTGAAQALGAVADNPIISTLTNYRENNIANENAAKQASVNDFIARTGASPDDYARSKEARDRDLEAQMNMIFGATSAPNAIKAAIPSLENAIVKEGAPIVRKTADLFIEKAKPLLDKTAEALKPGEVFNPKGKVRKTVESLFGDTSLQGTKGIIKKAGPAGEQIVNLLDEAEKAGAHLAGEATHKLQTVLKKLGPDDIDTFSDVVEGILPPVSQVQEEAVNAWRSIADDVQLRAKEAGIDMGTIENYFPHQTLDMTPQQQQALAEELVNSGKFSTVAEAMQGLEKEIGGLGRNAPRRYGNLELSRESDLPYNKSPNVLLDYVNNAYGRIADVTHFGQNDEKLYELAKAAGTQGGDTPQIAQYIDQILGKNQVPSKLGQKLTAIQTVTKLNPATSLTNLTQNLSTTLRTDLPTMAKTMKNIIVNPKEAFANATRVGEISKDMAKTLQDYTGNSKGVGKWIRLIGMEGTEKFNRVVSVNAGMEYAKKLASQASKGSKAAVRELERFGIKEIPKGGLTEDQLLEAGRKLSKMTQFSTKAGELPYAWRTEAGKVITQFKSFAYKQSGFLKEEAKRVGSETVKGNIKPLINALTVFGIAAPIAGEIVNDFKSVIKNKKREDTDTLTERYISNILGATSFGLLDSTSALFGQYGEAGVVGAVGGPTASDASKIVSGVSDVSSAVQGNKVDLKPVARNIVKEIPAVGQTISNTVIPNSYIDNYIGPNEGLTAPDKATYNNLQSADPAAAETFKQANRAQDKSKEGPNFLEKLFGGGKEEFNWEKTPTSKQGKKDFNIQVDKALEVEADIPDKALNTRFFDGKTYDGSNSQKEKVLKDALTVVDDEYLSPEQKAKIINSAKVSQDDLDYYRLAKMSETDKIQGVLDFAGNSELDHNKLIQTLALSKRRVGGAYILTPAVIDRLYDQGIIDKADKSLLTAVKYDSVGNKFYLDRDYKGTSTGLTPAKIKTYVNTVNTIFKSNIKSSASKQKLLDLPRAPKAKTLSPLS